MATLQHLKDFAISEGITLADSIAFHIQQFAASNTLDDVTNTLIDYNSANVPLGTNLIDTNGYNILGISIKCTSITGTMLGLFSVYSSNTNVLADFNKVTGAEFTFTLGDSNNTIQLNNLSQRYYMVQYIPNLTSGGYFSVKTNLKR